jgi:hypothetical protein
MMWPRRPGSAALTCTMGTLFYGEEEFEFKFGMLDLTTFRLD